MGGLLLGWTGSLATGLGAAGFFIFSALDKYELLLAEQYKELENGKYDDVTASVLGEMNSDSDEDD